MYFKLINRLVADKNPIVWFALNRVTLMRTAWTNSLHLKPRSPRWAWPRKMRNQKGESSHFISLYVCPCSPHYAITCLSKRTEYRKKKRGKGKGESSDKSDSDDVEVIKEWNTSSRGGNPEGRNRAEPVEEGKVDLILVQWAFFN